MSASPSQRRERCNDLLVQFAVYGLDQVEQAEMEEFIHEFEITDNDRFESSVGALDSGLATLSSNQLPEEFTEQLRLKIIRDADQHVGRQAAPATSEAPSAKPSPRPGDGWSLREKWFGLVTAASLLIALASVSGWFQKPESLPTAAEQLAEIRQAGWPDLRVAKWTNPTNDPASVDASGEVVWSDTRQEGYMVIRDLEINDPLASQYQLWIFDSARDDALPVDGGVFDINQDGELVIPINAKLSISEATMFAVTIETPGGVVQSKRERLPLLAKVEL